jgi:hypothetical protein
LYVALFFLRKWLNNCFQLHKHWDHAQLILVKIECSTVATDMYLFNTVINRFWKCKWDKSPWTDICVLTVCQKHINSNYFCALQDIVTVSLSFDLVAFMPLLREKIYTKNTFSWQFVISVAFCIGCCSWHSSHSFPARDFGWAVPNPRGPYQGNENSVGIHCCHLSVALFQYMYRATFFKIFIITNKCTINITKVYIMTVEHFLM